MTVAIVNYVVVLGSDELKRAMGMRLAGEKTSYGEPIAVLGLDKSDGAVEIEKGWRQKATETAIKEYFFGGIKARLSPFTQSASFDELVVFKAPDGEFSLCSLQLHGYFTLWQGTMLTRLSRTNRTIRRRPSPRARRNHSRNGPLDASSHDRLRDRLAADHPLLLHPGLHRHRRRGRGAQAGQVPVAGQRPPR